MDATIAVAVASFGTLLAVGGVMLWVGPSALLAPGPGTTDLVGAIIVVGLAGLGLLFGGFPRRTSRALRSTVPHMFPFGSVPLDIALYVLVFAIVACSTHALFDVFTGADNGGQVEGLSNQSALNWVLAGAYITLYLAAMYAVFLVGRVVRLGRLIDHHHHVDPYHNGPPEEARAPEWIPPTGPATPPSRYARPVLYIVSIIVGVGMSAAVQLFEVNLQPATGLQWLAGQAFTPLWALLIAWALAYLDTGTRTLEKRYVGVVPPGTSRPLGSPTDAPA